MPPNLEAVDHFSMVSPNDGHLYIFGGYMRPKTNCRIEIDLENSIATMRNIREVGTAPTPRCNHAAVMIGTSLIAIWGGLDLGGSFSDTDIHLFNLGKSYIQLAVKQKRAPTTAVNLDSGRWTTVKTLGSAPPPTNAGGSVAIGPTLYVYGGCSSYHSNEFWSIDLSGLAGRNGYFSLLGSHLILLYQRSSKSRRLAMAKSDLDYWTWRPQI